MGLKALIGIFVGRWKSRNFDDYVCSTGIWNTIEAVHGVSKQQETKLI